MNDFALPKTTKEASQTKETHKTKTIGKANISSIRNWNQNHAMGAETIHAALIAPLHHGFAQPRNSTVKIEMPTRRIKPWSKEIAES